jgi:hypothetical protein
LAEPTNIQIYQAELTGLIHDCKILAGRLLTLDEAIELRRTGFDVVVCGSNSDDNKNLARHIETLANGSAELDFPHVRAGKLALPHFHPADRCQPGHTFYERPPNKRAFAK